MSEERTIVLEGEIRWASVHNYKESPEGDEAFYKIDVEVTEEQYKKFLEAGISKNTMLRARGKNEPQDGKKFMTFRKRVWKRGDNGDIIKDVGATVKVMNEYGDTIENHLGNGTTAKVVVKLIPLKKSKFVKMKTELYSVIVTNLVEYSNDKEADDLTKSLLKEKPESNKEEVTTGAELW